MNKASKKSFNFLGFTMYWVQRSNRRELHVKTQKERLHKAINKFYDWAKDMRNKVKLKILWGLSKTRIIGHLNYYGYGMNHRKCSYFCRQAIKSLFKWVNRRSQKASYTWEGFMERLHYQPLYENFEKRKWKQLGWSFGRI